MTKNKVFFSLSTQKFFIRIFFSENSNYSEIIQISNRKAAYLLGRGYTLEAENDITNYQKF